MSDIPTSEILTQRLCLVCARNVDARYIGTALDGKFVWHLFEHL